MDTTTVNGHMAQDAHTRNWWKPFPSGSLSQIPWVFVVFPNSRSFPWLENWKLIFKVFPDFQSGWEPCNVGVYASVGYSEGHLYLQHRNLYTLYYHSPLKDFNSFRTTCMLKINITNKNWIIITKIYLPLNCISFNSIHGSEWPNMVDVPLFFFTYVL